MLSYRDNVCYPTGITVLSYRDKGCYPNGIRVLSYRDNRGYPNGIRPLSYRDKTKGCPMSDNPSADINQTKII